MNAVPTVYTPAEVIERYLFLRERKKELEAECNAKVAEIESSMDAMEMFLFQTMEEGSESTGAVVSKQQIKTKFGTAFKSPQMRATMTDRNAVVSSVLEGVSELVSACETFEELAQRATHLFDVFTNHVNKEWVKDRLEASVEPKGIEVRRWVGVNVRKA